MIKILILFLTFITFAHAKDNLSNNPKELQALVDQGNTQAMVKLGYFYFTGNQVNKSNNKAFNLYTLAAENGNLQAMNNLCNMYLYGEGVEKNLPLAFQLCSEPARAGNSSSMVMLAEIVQNIKVGPLSNDKKLADETAFKFYKMAAERDHIHGQYMLGQFYEQGRGTPIQIQQAIEWYQKAAQRNHKGAVKSLENIKTHNKAVKRDQ